MERTDRRNRGLQLVLAVFGLLLFAAQADAQGVFRVKPVFREAAPVAAPTVPVETVSKPELPPVDPRGFEARLNDDSHMKFALADESLEIAGRYGTLRIPAGDILRIEFATRLTEESKQQIEKALAELGSEDGAVRNAAGQQLARLRHAAFPSIAHAAENSETPAGKQAAMLMSKLQESVSEKEFLPRETDMVYTVDATIAGQIVAPALKVRTAQFGDLSLKLSDARSLRLQSLPPDEPEDEPTGQILTDPGTLNGLETSVGQVLRIRVTGATDGSVWGTEVYTTDSVLAAAAVHAGVLRPGATAVLKVKLVDPPPTFQGTPRNGVATNEYGNFPKAFQFVK